MCVWGGKGGQARHVPWPCSPCKPHNLPCKHLPLPTASRAPFPELPAWPLHYSTRSSAWGLSPLLGLSLRPCLPGTPSSLAPPLQVRMAFSATGLAKKDVLSRSDPFLAGLKQRRAGAAADEWVPTFRTEVCMCVWEGGGAGRGRARSVCIVVSWCADSEQPCSLCDPLPPCLAAGIHRSPAIGMNPPLPPCFAPFLAAQVRENNSDPLWQPIEVDIRQLCSADEQLPLRLQVRDGGARACEGALTGCCAGGLADSQRWGLALPHAPWLPKHRLRNATWELFPRPPLSHPLSGVGL